MLKHARMKSDLQLQSNMLLGQEYRTRHTRHTHSGMTSRHSAPTLHLVQQPPRPEQQAELVTASEEDEEEADEADDRVFGPAPIMRPASLVYYDVKRKKTGSELLHEAVWIGDDYQIDRLVRRKGEPAPFPGLLD